MRNKILPLIVLLAALGLATIAAYYSVFGISKLFSAQASAVIVMATVLEASKLITAAYLERFWKTIHWIRKVYLVLAMLILMSITSLGIYGFLVSAYQETAYAMQAVDKQVEMETRKQDRYKQRVIELSADQVSINRQITELSVSLGNNVVQYTNRDGQLITTQSSKTRSIIQEQLSAQTARRDSLTVKQDAMSDSVTVIDMRILDLETNSEVSAEIGPLKYVAQITNQTTDKVVNWFILLFIIVFDPLAIILLISANKALGRRESEPSHEADTEEFEGPECEEEDYLEPNEELKEVAQTHEEVDTSVGNHPIADVRRGRVKVGSKLWDPKD
tara:strand:- start:1144 stop:2139 length:996 start_codon:yes stop_codon:yes gene_type:complete